MKYFYVYIMCSQRNGTLYIGITSNLSRRIIAHKNNVASGFVSKYTVHLLVYYEIFESSVSAIRREKQLKNWHRSWKLTLIYSSHFEIPTFLQPLDETLRQAQGERTRKVPARGEPVEPFVRSIEKLNPEWVDLSGGFLESLDPGPVFAKASPGLPIWSAIAQRATDGSGAGTT